MTDQAPDRMSDEITPGEMRVLLVAMGAEQTDLDPCPRFRFRGKECLLSTWVLMAEAGDCDWLTVRCWRFLESEKVREDYSTNLYTQGWTGPEIYVFDKYHKLLAKLTDPDPAVRWVKAAIAVAKELAAQRGKDGGK